MKRQLLICILVAGSLLVGCSIDNLPFVYRPDVHQGTVLSQEMVDQLRAGMSRRQVQFVLGSPSLVDPFHSDRWEYIEAVKSGREQLQSQRLTIFFDNDRLIAVEGDFQPQDQTLRRNG